jgi:selenocysteine-specific elongation factor
MSSTASPDAVVASDSTASSNVAASSDVSVASDVAASSEVAASSNVAVSSDAAASDSAAAPDSAAVTGSVVFAGRAGGAAVAVLVGDLLVSRRELDRLAGLLVELVARHHASQPDSEGVPRGEVRDRLGVGQRVFDYLVSTLEGAGRIAGRERLALAGHRVVVGDADAVALARLEGVVLEAGLRALDVGELAGVLQVSGPAAERLVGLLVRAKRLVKLGTLLYHPDVLARLREETRALKTAAPAGRAVVNVASFKTRYDVSRKYAIPLLEYLDRERVTRRVGDERVVL